MKGLECLTQELEPNATLLVAGTTAAFWAKVNRSPF